MNKLRLLALILAASLALDALAQLEGIVVTAQKREEKYTDVPVSVATLSGETLDNAQVTEFQELIQVSPSVTFNQSGDMRGAGILIRGVGTTAFQTAIEPTVSVVVDGVTLGRTVQFLADLDDIERVEVLRGPQGTLFGKNASAGLINVVTKRPADLFEGSVRVTGTDDDMIGLTAQVSGPLSDSVNGRLAFYTRNFDGFSKNHYTGETVNGDESLGVRGKLEFSLASGTNLLLIADYSRQDRDCCNSARYDLGGNPFYEFDYAQHHPSRDHAWVNDENADLIYNTPSYSNTNTWGGSLAMTRELANWELTAITAYRDFQLDTQQDPDGLTYSEATYGRFIVTSNGTPGKPQRQFQLSQELRLASTAWETLDLTLGLYYWDQALERYFQREVYFCLAPGAAASLDPDPVVTGCTSHLYGFGEMFNTVDFENWALFSQADWHLTDRLTASLGLRYTSDDIAYTFRRVTPNPGPAVQASFASEGATDDSALTGKLSMQYDLTESAMIYAAYSEGYKAPAYDIIFGFQVNQTDPVPAEKSQGIEVGLKAELLSNTLRLGATLFSTDFDDLQGQGFDANELAFVLTSVGTAQTEGLELDITWKPIDNLLITGGLAVVHATYENFTEQECFAGQTAAQGCPDINPATMMAIPANQRTQDLSGKNLPNSPDLKYAVQIRYDLPLAASFDLNFTLGYRWQDEVISATNGDPRSLVQDFGILDLGLVAQSHDGRWATRFFAKNALDDFYAHQRIPNIALLGGGGNHWLLRDAQRYIGAEVEYRFGNL